MKITVNDIEYTVSETKNQWKLNNTSGKTSVSFVVSKVEVKSIQELIEYVRCM